MSIILNEREHAEAALQNLVLNKKPIETLSCVAKYYYSEGYKRKEIEQKLESFLLRCEPDISILKWQNTISWLVRGAEKYPLVEIDHIPITRNEIALCNKQKSKHKQQLLFTLICFAKFSNKVTSGNSNWVNRQDREIFKAANIAISVKRQSLMLNDLREEGYIKFSKRVDSINIIVLCLDNESEPELYISDFRNLGFQLAHHNGESYFECQSCGVTVKKKVNNQKYCSDCAAKANREKALENWHKKHQTAS